jgi:hypothetical protein
MSFLTRPFALDLPEKGGTNIVMVAASRAGKTSIMKYLVDTHFKKHISVMFSMNPMTEIYKDMPSHVHVSEHFHPEIIHDMHEINKLTDNHYKFCVISDDYVDVRIKNHPEITRLLTIHRNANLSSIFVFQGRTLLNAVGRNNAHFIIIGRQNSPKEYECVIKEFLSGWLPHGMSMTEMIRFVSEACKDYQFFVIDNLKGECFLTKLTRAQAGLV